MGKVFPFEKVDRQDTIEPKSKPNAQKKDLVVESKAIFYTPEMNVLAHTRVQVRGSCFPILLFTFLCAVGGEMTARSSFCCFASGKGPEGCGWG